MSAFAAAARRLRAMPRLDLIPAPSAVHGMRRLRAELNAVPRLLVKRDDAIPFGFGGNKIRKLAFIASRAVESGADTLMTVGGIQSNHCRATAAVAATLGMRCVLVLNGERPARPSGNLLLDTLLGAEVHYVARREDRAPAMAAIAADLRRAGRKPVEIPLGASTPLGALGLALAVGELVDQGIVPDLIVHSSSSGGTQAGLTAGCTIFGVPTRVLGVSADTPAAELQAGVRAIITGMGELLGVDGATLAAARPIEVDDTRVGGGYGVPTDASREAAELLAKREGIFVDHTYTAKAAAGLIAGLREDTLGGARSVLFWHTGGQVGIFAD